MSGALRPCVGGLLYAAVALAVVIGLVLIAIGPWRSGAGLCGGALVAAGIARAAMPERMAGLLRVRRRAADVVIMLGMGIALVVLAVIIPDQP